MSYTEGLYDEKTYTESELRALFKAIYEGKINRIAIHDLHSRLDYSIAPVVFCKDCRYKEKDAISEGCHYCDKTGMQVTDDFHCGYGKEEAVDPVE